jgi:hypothetical protein
VLRWQEKDSGLKSVVIPIALLKCHTSNNEVLVNVNWPFYLVQNIILNNLMPP